MKIIYALLATFIITNFSCKTNQQNNQPIDTIPEHETIKFPSQILNEERIINIWTPKSYKESSDSLPVMYMADGGIQEDFPHIANTLAELVDNGTIAPLILVGIENTQRRRDLSGPTEVEKDKEIAPVVGGSENFRNFIKEELIPEIEKKYRTTSEKSIIGESLSGLFVMETFFLTPELFDNYIAFDPSLWWNNQYLVRTAKEKLAMLPPTNKRLWFAGSSATDISVHTQELAKILSEQNIPTLNWQYSDEPNEKHSTIFRATKVKAISWTLGKK